MAISLILGSNMNIHQIHPLLNMFSSQLFHIIQLQKSCEKFTICKNHDKSYYFHSIKYYNFIVDINRYDFSL